MTATLDLISELPSLSLETALVLCRVSAAVMLLPGIGEADPPPTLRAGLAMGMTCLVAPGVASQALDPSISPFMIVLMLLRELLCGFFLGLIARLAALALPIAAQMMTLMIGLTSVIQPDPELGAQSSGLTRLFSLAAPALLLSSGLYRLPIEAIATSYQLIPLGGVLPLNDATNFVVKATGETFACAFRLASPFVLAGTLWQVCLGLLTRLVPSMQAGAALMPGQLLGGMILLGALSETLIAEWTGSAGTTFSELGMIFHG